MDEPSRSTSLGARLGAALPWLVAIAALGEAVWATKRARTLEQPDPIRVEILDDSGRRFAPDSALRLDISRDGRRVAVTTGGVRYERALEALDTRRDVAMTGLWASRPALDAPGRAALGVLDGFLVYATPAGRIEAVRFDGRRTTGDPMLMVDSLRAPVVAALSENGSLATVTGTGRVVLVYNWRTEMRRKLAAPR
jgi:hypothetical protein